MQEFKIYSKTGRWARSSAQFPLVAPTGERFEPGVATKVDLTDWIEGQEAIKPCDDPTVTDEDVAAAAAQAEATAQAEALATANAIAAETAAVNEAAEAQRNADAVAAKQKEGDAAAAKQATADAEAAKKAEKAESKK